MAKAAKPIPQGYHTITPHLVVRGAAEAIEFYKRAFGAEELDRSPGPDGKRLMHAEVRIGSSRLLLVDEYPEYGSKSPQALGGSAVTIHLYVEDVDGLFDRAVKAGCTVEMPLMDAFWGDRFGQLVDPFGHKWSLATHKEDLTPEEMAKRAEAFFSSAGGGHPGK
jgi:uncharacterized glyoxalase superfamily protein PhnB